MEEQPGKRNLYVVATCLSLLLVGVIIGAIVWRYMNADPGYTITKKNIAFAELTAFKKKIERMVLSYTVRREGNVPIVHPPAGSDIYMLVSTEGWGKYILELEQGKSYRLNLASLDIKHTLAIRGLHLFNPIAPGELATIKFSPAKAGRFALQCGYICGPWHDSMNSAIIVVASPVIAMNQKRPFSADKFLFGHFLWLLPPALHNCTFRKPCLTVQMPQPQHKHWLDKPGQYPPSSIHRSAVPALHPVRLPA